MLKRTEGIVLRSFPFGEADLIVTYLTRDYGLMKLFAKSPRKTKSRFGSSLEPLTYATISFLGKEEASLPRLTQSDIIRPFQSLRNDFRCFLRVSELLDVTIRFLPEREPNAEAFSLLLHTLLRLSSDCANDLYYLYHKVRLLEISGFSPRFDTCGNCGLPINTVAPSPGASHSFFLSHGAVICGRCSGGDGGVVRLSDGTVRFYKSLIGWNPARIHRMRAHESLLSGVRDAIDSHIAHILGRSGTLKKGEFIHHHSLDRRG
ncbi:MAG: DNA repair protein RecO [Thermodesulfovibrionales bacterium]|jgi:DNA repair protein RecO (recombination protein O)